MHTTYMNPQLIFWRTLLCQYNWPGMTERDERIHSFGSDCTPAQLLTPRLLLRPFCEADIPELVPLINDFRVTGRLGRVPFPYSKADAEFFLRQVCPSVDNVTLAITCRTSRALMGCVSLHGLVAEPRRMGEIGYWIAFMYWGKGFATEAATGLLRFAFSESSPLALDVVRGAHFVDNPNSGRVQQKLGFVYDAQETASLKDGGESSLPRMACLARGGKEFATRTLWLTREQFARRQQEMMDIMAAREPENCSQTSHPPPKAEGTGLGRTDDPSPTTTLDEGPTDAK